MSMRTLLTLGLLLSAASLGGCQKAPPAAGPAPFVVPETAPEPEPAFEAPEPVQEIVKNFQRVYFNFDTASLSSETRSALSENAALLQQHTDVKIEIQGHADERGTTEYNLALGQKRADSVKRFLSAQGVAASRLSVISYGEERPLEGVSTETAWSKNRRAEFRVTWGEAPLAGTTN
jgi:peptidoglycan-associated lipoprotein